MNIIKIKNLKYVPSKNKEIAQWAEAAARRNRLLIETDWTQLPDVKLSEPSRNEWMNWRNELRNLKKINFTSIEKLNFELNRLENIKNTLSIEYTDEVLFKNLNSGKKYLHKLLVQYYTEKLNYEFSPNLEEKYQETLDIISIYLSNNSKSNVESFKSMNELIDYITDCAEIDINILNFPFVELTQQIKNFSIKDTILYILNQKQKQFNFSLQEEYNLIHYEHRIDFCNSIDDILKAKREIDLNYGH